MVAIIFLVWLVHSPIQYTQVVRERLEKEMCLHGSVCKCQEGQRIWLLWDLEQSGSSQGVTLWAALQQWPLWAAAAALVLLLVLCFLL